MNTLHVLHSLAHSAADAAEPAQDLPLAGPLLLAAAVTLPLLGVAAVFLEALLPTRGPRT